MTRIKQSKLNMTSTKKATRREFNALQLEGVKAKLFKESIALCSIEQNRMFERETRISAKTMLILL